MMNATTACMSEASQLRPTPFGELFDVVLSDIEPHALSRYGAIILVGDQDFAARDSRLLKALGAAVQAGAELLLQDYHLAALTAAGAPWLPAARSRHQLTILPRRSAWRTELPPVLTALSRRQAPLRVRADQPIQWQVNTRPAGSKNAQNATLVKVVNNNGVKKCANAAEVVLPGYDAQVAIEPGFAWGTAAEHISGQYVSGQYVSGQQMFGGPLSFQLKAGETAIWEFV